MDRAALRTRSKLMSKIKSKNTKIELSIRSALWKRGFRYRIHYCKEKIDVAFPKEKIAIFVDGCFWHSCPIHGHKPRSNIDYWGKKLEKNIERSRAKDRRLTEEGWIILHFWEHEILTDLESCVRYIERKIQSLHERGNE